jgi:hypothetical protein
LHFTAALAPGASPSCLLLACVDRGASLLNAAIPATTRRGTSRSEWRCERGEPSVEHQAGDQASEMQISICFSGNGSHQSVQISGLDFAGHRGSESQFGDWEIYRRHCKMKIGARICGLLVMLLHLYRLCEGDFIPVVLTLSILLIRNMSARSWKNIRSFSN